MPLDLGFPVWCDDPEFGLSNHARREHVPAPGSEEQLQAPAGQLTCAVTGDSDHAPDTDILCKGIDDGIAELLAVS